MKNEKLIEENKLKNKQKNFTFYRFILHLSDIQSWATSELHLVAQM